MFRDTANVCQVSAEKRARRQVSKHPRRRTVDRRVELGLDAALEEVRGEIADDELRSACAAHRRARADESADDGDDLSEAQVRYLAALRVKPCVGVGMRMARVRGRGHGDRQGCAVRGHVEYSGVRSLGGSLQGGRCVGYRRKYSDRMRELLAKALMPESEGLRFDSSRLHPLAASGFLGGTDSRMVEAVFPPDS